MAETLDHRAPAAHLPMDSAGVHFGQGLRAAQAFAGL
jgi:hypothetical protein